MAVKVSHPPYSHPFTNGVGQVNSVWARWIEDVSGALAKQVNGEVHNDLAGRSADDCHPIGAISGLSAQLASLDYSDEITALQATTGQNSTDIVTLQQGVTALNQEANELDSRVDALESSQLDPDDFVKKSGDLMTGALSHDYGTDTTSTLTNDTFEISRTEETVETTYTDSRDGTVYPVVEINGLLWMAENLRYNLFGQSVDNNSANDALYGRLYNISESVAGIEPGWRLATEADLQNLIDFVGASNGSKVKSSLTGGSQTWTTVGTDDYGFKATGSGFRSGNVQYEKNVACYFWTNTVGTASASHRKYFTLTNAGDMSIFSPGDTNTTYMSVRYVKDATGGGTTTTKTTVTADDITTTTVNADIVELNNAYTPTGSEPIGSMYYDQDNETISVPLPNGVTGQMFEEFYKPVINQTGSTISEFHAVSYGGTDGNSGKLKIVLAIADGTQEPELFLGVTTHDILNGATGKVTVDGKVRGVNTSGSLFGETWADSDVIYVSPTTAGHFTNVMPSYPDIAIKVGYVVNAHATNGTIDVDCVATASDVLTKSNATLAGTGFEDPANTTVSYDYGTRKITTAGTGSSLFYKHFGIRDSSSWLSDARPVGNGAWFLKYNSNGYEWAQQAWQFSDAPIAFGYKGSACELWLREPHGVGRNWVWHRDKHQNFGTYKTAGGDFSGYTLNSTTATNRRPQISSTTLWDEDVQSVLDALTTNSYAWMWLTGTNTVNITTGNAEIISLNGSNPEYNVFSAGSWGKANFTNLQYGKIFVVGIPTADDATSKASRYLHIMPQTVSSNLSVIQSVSPDSVNWGELQNVLPEFNFIGEIIVRYIANNWQLIEVNKITGNRFTQSTTGAGYLSTVATDGTTIVGDGTGANPLGLAHGDYLDVSATGQTKAGALALGSTIAPPSGTILQIGDITTANQPTIVIGLTKTADESSHGFTDKTNWAPASGTGKGHASFDAKATSGGAGSTKDHMVAFQSRLTHPTGVGTLAVLWGHKNEDTIDGAVTTHVAYDAKSPTGTGAIENEIGFHCENLSRGTVSKIQLLLEGTDPTWAIKAEGKVLLTASGNAKSSALQIESSRPSIRLSESDQGTNGKEWDWTVNGGVMAFRIMQDDTGSPVTWQEVTRSGNTITKVNTIAPFWQLNTKNRIDDYGTDGILRFRKSSSDRGISLILDSSGRNTLQSSIVGTSYEPLTIDGSDVKLDVSGTTRVNCNSTGIGFFGATPVAKPSTTNDITSVRNALISLGLIS